MGRRESGFTLIEVIIVVLLLAVAVAVAVPRALTPSPTRQVEVAARTLTRDLSQLRMRAIAAKRKARMRFNDASRFYSAFIDVTPNRSGAIAETVAEVQESGLQLDGSHAGIPGVKLPGGVQFGAGSASTGPGGVAIMDPIDLPNDMIEFSSRGLVVPPSTGGVVYLTHRDDPSAVAAVTISGASAFQTWRYVSGSWVR